MRILIYALSAREGGGQTYIQNLFTHLPQRDGLEIFLLAPRNLSLPASQDVVVHRLPSNRILDNPIFRAIWEMFFLRSMVAKLKVDVIFFTGGLILSYFPRSCKVATVFHNMLPFAPKEAARFALGYTRFRIWLLRTLQKWSFYRADLLIFISKYAQSIIERFLPARRGISALIPHGIHQRFRTSDHSLLAKPENIPARYVLYVSYLTVYKAQIEVIEAWAQVKKSGLNGEKLVLIGDGYLPYVNKVKNTIIRLNLQQDVILMGNVPHAELPNYYRHALINVFASSCENCPYILLEALAAGRPVLSSSFAPMPEIGGNGAEYFNPYQPEMLATLLIKYLRDEDLCEQLGREALAQSEKFQCRDTAAKTWDALLSLAQT